MTPQLKFLSVMFIWGMATAITILQLVINDGANFNWIFSVVLFAMAAAGTSSITGDDEKKKGDTVAEGHSNTDNSNANKRKNDQAGRFSPDMMALLDDDDIAELRQRMKNRLIERIEGGGDGELSSLDALLADQDEAPRKSRR